VSIKLSITAANLDDQDLQDLTRSLCQTINNETGVRATLSEDVGGVENKGDLVQFGQILLTFQTSGTAIVLVEVVKAYFEQSASIEMEFEREDGRKMRIRAENTKPDQIDSTHAMAKEFFES
jgi:hypothetical protein